jgi:RNA polymerase sigma factor (sigma-70 family)
MIGTRPAPPEPASWSAERLVEACRGGDASAWSALVARYKNLIYSIPVRDGLPAEDAADVFQSVCLDLLSELPRLREPRALPAWLIRVTRRHCMRRRRLEERHHALDRQDDSRPGPGATPEWARQLEREQLIREAIATLSARCRELVQMLFFVEPPLPYRDVARRLHLAEGSIGFIRGRCLDQLRRRLEEER